VRREGFRDAGTSSVTEQSSEESTAGYATKWGHGVDQPAGCDGGEARCDVYRAIISAAADGIVLIDEDKTIRLCNQAAADWLSCAGADHVGSRFAFPVTVNRPTEIEWPRDEGPARVSEIRASPIALHGERLYVVTLRDITRRRHTERMLQGALEQQTTAVAVATHELRSPANAISVSAKLLRQRRTVLTEEERVSFLDRIVERVDHLQSIMDKLRTASRIDAACDHVSSEPHLVLDLLSECLAEFDQQRRQVPVSCPPELAVLADRTEFVQMLTNYLDNAFTHGSPPVHVQATARGSYVEIRVCDRGPGVAEEFVPHLFERFSRVQHPQTTTGMGLGLWIVRNLAEANGGDAWYESLDDGSSFCLRLPAPPRAPHAPSDGGAHVS
jgi:signal transduction histidine kinase